MLGLSSYLYSPHPHQSAPAHPLPSSSIGWLHYLLSSRTLPTNLPWQTVTCHTSPTLSSTKLLSLSPTAHCYIICLMDHLTLVTPFINNDLNLNFWKIIMFLLYWMVYKGSNYIPTAYFLECRGVLDSFDEPRSRQCAMMLSHTHQLATQMSGKPEHHSNFPNSWSAPVPLIRKPSWFPVTHTLLLFSMPPLLSST